MKTSLFTALLLLVTLSSFGCANETDACTYKSCDDGNHCLVYKADGNYPGYGACSSEYDGAVCCTPGGGQQSGKTTTCSCPASARWNCGNGCYSSPPSGNHACVIPAGC